MPAQSITALCLGLCYLPLIPNELGLENYSKIHQVYKKFYFLFY